MDAMTFQQLQQKSPWVFYTESFQKLEDSLRAAQKDKEGKTKNGDTRLSRNEVIDIVKKSDLYGKFPEDEIIEKIKDDGMSRVGGIEINDDMISGTQETLDDRTLAGVISDYMQNSIKVKEKTPEPEDFLNFINEKMINMPEGQKKEALAAVANQIQNDQTTFEKDMRVEYDKWLVTNLRKGPKEKNSEYEDAVRHLKYCKADSLEYIVNTKEKNEDDFVSLGIKVDTELTKEFNEEDDENKRDDIVIFKNIPMKEIRKEKKENLSVFEEVDKWDNVGGNNLKTLQDFLYELDMNDKKKELEKQDYERTM